MRGSSRSPLVVALSVVAVSGMFGAGCQSQAPGLANPLLGSGFGAGAGGLTPSPSLTRAAEPGLAGGRALAELGTPLAEARGDEDGIRPVVWRASSRGVEREEKPPVEAVAWKVPFHQVPVGPVRNELPRELDKVTMPPYRIEPPDVLLIDSFRVVPRPPYHIEPLDELLIFGDPKYLPLNEPINTIYPVDNEGRVDLGFRYGKFQVAGLTTDEAVEALRKEITKRNSLKEPQIVVSLARTRGFQQVRGEHLVRMDGTVSLGVYGDVFVAGKTLEEVKAAVRAQLSKKLLNPEVTVDVAAYNSKVYYVIFDGGGLGQQLVRLPVVGGETVLDALAQVYGLPQSSSDKRIWVARPVPGGAGHRQILPVDWQAITEGAATNTNYQLFPGDRIYVKADHWIAFNNRLNKLLTPLERMFGVTLLGNATIRAVDGQRNGGL